MIRRASKSRRKRTDNPFLVGIQDHVLNRPVESIFRHGTEEYFVWRFGIAYSDFRRTHNESIGFYELEQILTTFCPSVAASNWKYRGSLKPP